MILLNHSSKKLVIAVDGPAGSGKSTVSKILARELGYLYVNTGNLYRYITYCALKKGFNIRDSELMENFSKKIVEQFVNENNIIKNIQLIFDDNNEMFKKIHSPEIDKNVSFASYHASVRKNLIPLQRLLAKNKSIVIEGRDIGTVILPDADIKFFIVADKKTRVSRRYKELQEKGYKVSLEEVESEIIKRDDIDSKREFAPLTIPEDAIILDNSTKNINEVVKTMLKIIQKH